MARRTGQNNRDPRPEGRGCQLLAVLFSLDHVHPLPLSFVTIGHGLDDNHVLATAIASGQNATASATAPGEDSNAVVSASIGEDGERVVSASSTGVIATASASGRNATASIGSVSILQGPLLILF